jgi:hypothetical protein
MRKGSRVQQWGVTHRQQVVLVRHSKMRKRKRHLMAF